MRRMEHRASSRGWVVAGIRPATRPIAAAVAASNRRSLVITATRRSRRDIAALRSYCACSPIQTIAGMPSASSSATAVSAVMLRRPRTIALTSPAGRAIALASDACVISRASSSSRSISPGWSVIPTV